MDSRIKFVDFLDAVKGIQDIIKNENTERVERNLEHVNWDLIQELKITPTNLTLMTDSTIIEFDTKLNISEIKSDIKKIIIAKSANHQIRGWDGFVGNVPEELKKSMKRDSKLNDLFNE